MILVSFLFLFVVVLSFSFFFVFFVFLFCPCFLRMIHRQGLALGTTTCADCTAGFYCAAGSLNVYGGTNNTGANYVLVSTILC